MVEYQSSLLVSSVCELFNIFDLRGAIQYNNAILVEQEFSL